MEEIFVEIAEERGRQDFKWGGPAHDDLHDVPAWLNFIMAHTKKAEKVSADWSFDLKVFRKQMVRVAALALAAIEWVDRR
jgi:hypothetical protein